VQKDFCLQWILNRTVSTADLAICDMRADEVGHISRRELADFDFFIHRAAAKKILPTAPQPELQWLR
jgi:hypothetical protein